MEENRERLISILARFIAYSAKHLPDDVYAKLEEMRAEEDGPRAKAFYDAMFQDLKMADELDRPVCQDTGIQQFFVQAGADFPLRGELGACLQEAVLRATKEAPLRPNVVDVFTDRNTGTNAGLRIPWIDWEIVPDSDEAMIYLYMAGGGCSLPGFARVLPPLEGIEGVCREVFDQIATLGINACPPLLVGIGLAGSMEVAAKLSKKALLRPIGSHNEDPHAAELEKRTEEGLNAIGIGPGGVTGRRSVMGVHVETAGRHPATIAMGLSVSCWVHRRAVLRLGPDLAGSDLSHSGADAVLFR